jgi:hypothetical protein
MVPQIPLPPLAVYAERFDSDRVQEHLFYHDYFGGNDLYIKPSRPFLQAFHCCPENQRSDQSDQLHGTALVLHSTWHIQSIASLIVCGS